MLTIKLPITHCSKHSFLTDKMIQYNFAFRVMFKNIEESSTNNYIDNFKKRFNLNDIEYRSLKSQVESFINKENTQKIKIRTIKYVQIPPSLIRR